MIVCHRLLDLGRSRRTVPTAALTALLVLTPLSTSMRGQDRDAGARVTLVAAKSFDQVTDAVESQVSKHGMRVVSQVNQSRMLFMAGMRLDATLFLIGNPSIGRQLFEQNHAVGLYVPLRVSVYVETDGKTYVQYEKPSATLAQFNNQKLTALAQTLDRTLSEIVTAAAR
jgi:uncharacterized protein (DUF302 family)